jgi:Family of unknown function (DUF716)
VHALRIRLLFTAAASLVGHMDAQALVQARRQRPPGGQPREQLSACADVSMLRSVPPGLCCTSSALTPCDAHRRYGGVALSGAVDLVGHYGSLPAGTEQVFLGLAFLGETLLMGLHAKHNPLDQLLHVLLTALMVGSSAVCFAEVAYSRSLLLALARPLFVMLQGSWFIEIGRMLFLGEWPCWVAGVLSKKHEAHCGVIHGSCCGPAGFAAINGRNPACSLRLPCLAHGAPGPHPAGIKAWDMRDHAAVMAAPVIFTLHMLGMATLFLLGGCIDRGQRGGAGRCSCHGQPSSRVDGACMQLQPAGRPWCTASSTA